MDIFVRQHASPGHSDQRRTPAEQQAAWARTVVVEALVLTTGRTPKGDQNVVVGIVDATHQPQFDDLARVIRSEQGADLVASWSISYGASDVAIANLHLTVQRPVRDDFAVAFGLPSSEAVLRLLPTVAYLILIPQRDPLLALAGERIYAEGLPFPQDVCRGVPALLDAWQARVREQRGHGRLGRVLERLRAARP